MSVNVFCFWIGVMGGVVMLIGESIVRALGITAIDLSAALAHIWTPKTADFFPVRLLGILTHLGVAGVIGMIYGLIFQLTARSGAKVGAVVGLAHWMVIGLLMGFLPPSPVHLYAPGIFGSAYGGLAILEILVLHLIYGAVVGEFYRRAHDRRIFRHELNPERATSPLADSLGQGQTSLEDYKGEDERREASSRL